jgi:hypothetical protein
MSYVSPFTGDVVQPTDVSYRGFDLSVNTQLAWPINGNASGNYAARIMEVTATTAGLTLRMPPANQTSVGTDSLIRGLGANSFTVADYDGNVICTVSAGEANYIYITENPDAAGTWGLIFFGVGTADVDAATLQGYGIIALGSTLNQSHPTTDMANGYTFASTDRAQVKIWNGGAGTATLPTAASVGDNWFSLFKNNGTGTVTISAASGELIDGNSTKDFQPAESSFLISTGTEFITIGYGVSTNFVFTSLVKPIASGNYNLTPNEAQNTIQQFIGTLTGNVTITYPPAVNIYVVSNQTIDNGYTLTLTTGIPSSATAIIPVGQQATLICDGTNMLNANTISAGATAITLINGTETSPSLSFAFEPSTGMYRPGAGQMNVTLLGNDLVEYTAAGMNVIGTGNFEDGIFGGTF